MKSIYKISVTKIVLLIIVVSLVAIEIYKTLKGMELDQVFVDLSIMIGSYYFAQKWMKYESVDSLIKEDKEDVVS